jgi:hypothetical protein
MSSPFARVVPSPVALAEGLHVLGGLIELDGRVSWAPPTARGHQPSNCYALVEGDRVLLVDTGLAIHEGLVLDGLASLIGEGAPLTMFFTRGEMDCVSNLEPIGRRFDIEALYTGGATNPFDAFDELNAMRLRTRRRQIDQKGAGGDSMARTPLIEFAPARALAIESPLLRLLPTFWGWDAGTGALFTSDSFTHGTLADASDSRVIDSPDGVTLDEVAAHLFAKYWWLPYAHTDPLREWLAAKFEQLEPEIVAPTRGCVLRGRDTVRRHVDLMLAALAIRA